MGARLAPRATTSRLELSPPRLLVGACPLLASEAMWLCPGCGAREGRQVRSVDATEAAICFARPTDEPERYEKLVASIRDLWGSGEARIVECGVCDLRTADPFVAGDREFFSVAYGRRSAAPYPQWRWEYKLSADVVAGIDGSILDVGAGDGAFQKILLEAGVDATRLFATEYDVDAGNALTRLGVRVASEDLRQLPRANHAVVCGHNVIQHLDDLDGVFRAFDWLVSPDGFVILSMSNGIHKLNEEAAGGLVDLPPNHISTWRRSSIVAAATRRGWKVVDYQEQPVSRLSSARSLAIARTHAARKRPNSLTSVLERRATTPRMRHNLMAVSAASRLPAALLRSHKPYGGAVWTLLCRA